MPNSSAQPPVPIASDMDCAITATRLLYCVPGLTRAAAEIHAAALEAARDVARLNTTRRVRHFLAQCAHETGGLKSLEENLRYSDPARLDRIFSQVQGLDHAKRLIAAGPQAIGDCVYAGRGGNGPHDGWRYRGRGYLHTTLRDNYAAAEKATGLPLLADPDLLLQPGPAAQAAAIFWRDNGINHHADSDNTAGVTRKINPAMEGLDERTTWSARFRKVWP